ncbi:NADPH-dependent F420 reductase [Actinomadura sp. 6N118]|uniref:NADPH-dependent F420 reductase n=1 Tax=Actinomadura sp. 6N118 TaxID=3375151 RepID=UPI0037A6F6FE
MANSVQGSSDRPSSVTTTLARLAVVAGIPVVIANSRGPESLAGLVSELGPLASAGTPEQAAHAGEPVVLSVPLTAIESVPAQPLRGRTVVDTTNYYPSRDGRVAELDAETVTTSELVQRHLAGAYLVKAFNNILAHRRRRRRRQEGGGSTDRPSTEATGQGPLPRARLRPWFSVQSVRRSGSPR